MPRRKEQLGGRGNKEERATWKKERRRGKSNEEEGATRRVKYRKNGKKGKMNKWLEDASLTTMVLCEFYGIVLGTPGIKARVPREVHMSLMALWP